MAFKELAKILMAFKKFTLIIILQLQIAWLKKSLGRPTGCAREEQAEAAVPSVPISDNLQGKYLLDLSVRWHRLGHVLPRRHAPPDAAAM